MDTLRLKALLGAGCFSLALIGAVHAGGLERGGYNIDLLFDPAPVAGELSGTYVMPDRKLKNVVDAQTGNGLPGGGNLNGRPNSADETESYFVPRVGFKASIGQQIDCMADYSQPWGAHTNPGSNWAGANSNIETKINSDNYAATCSYKFDVGKGQLRFIGGVFYQEVDGFKERLVQDTTIFPFPINTLSGVGRLDLAGNGVGWRIGTAYEIPEIALRASLVYNSAVDLGEITGTLDLSQVPGQPTTPLNVFGTQSMPQSVEFKLQSGIAPGWLAFGSVKWVDWSQLGIVSFCSTAIKAAGLSCAYGGPGFLTSLDLLYRDGWTISGGIGHKFNEQWSGAATLTWDRGTTTGLSSLTDTWTVAAGVSYTPSKNIEVRFGGAVGILTSGSVGPENDPQGFPHGTDVSYNFGNDLVTALSTSVKIKW
ncbi:OmpP1/FadL family transporter [Mesorhizobium opportunistum]|uniref:OmpP1/FadL family transporter n=1 Tax=Mesorhizobium opportunistum TaxID=593909 RepID=A0ABV1YAD1_9HYPH|nr:OmpP1/FadL family transporter [Mesorhizobium sp.]TIN94793.1 MAG: transporter [Mesorhizobium sp.]TJU96689.1 MAG: transporter [Mesorhizobium sp.]TJV18708.1 MAG: transporter [Mesorhizobium sp.]